MNVNEIQFCRLISIELNIHSRCVYDQFNNKTVFI